MALFALGFLLGAIRVMVVAPRVGPLMATLAEVPVMLAAAFFACRAAVRRWRVPRSGPIRLAMMLWFLALLFTFEWLLGAVLFGRTASQQWAAVVTPPGLLGLSAQLLAALLPLFVERRNRPSSG